MCRILFTNMFDVTTEVFSSGLMKMVHGGPDAPGCVTVLENFKLGHNRLSILDLNERSNQPFLSTDNRYLIIYNGEVYNYQELAKQYNIILKTNCDTELILELSLKIGFEKALKLFNGMFAYIIFDTKSKGFFVARDRLGVKPLYFYQKGGEFIFSSEINAIVELLRGQVDIDDIGLRQYRKLRTFFNGHTIYKNIKFFPAGCYMESAQIKEYWQLPRGRQNPPEDDELKYLIESSIKYRKISDVSLGSYLSGGLDSSIVATLTQELHTWTVGFEDNNEFVWGRIVAANIDSQHHEVIVTKEQFLEDVQNIVSIRQEPLSVPNEVLLYQMTKKVQEKNKVVLSGEGADELFFGYDRIFQWAKTIKTIDIQQFSAMYSYGSNEDLDIVESVISPFYDYGDPVDIIAAFFQIAHLHGLLRRLDSSTMLCSVEARVPFVDYRLVERMAGVSMDYRMQDGIIKAPLKRIFRDILPKEIIEREKVGFPVDLTQIFNITKDKTFDAWFNLNLQYLKET